MNNISLVKNIIVRIGLIVILVVVYQAVLIFVGASKAQASHVCGIEPGGGDSSQKMEYAGLVMNLVVQRYDGSRYEALGNIGMVFTGDNNSPPGYWGAELALYSKNSPDPHQSTGVIPQTGGHDLNMLNCWYTGDGAGVVLGSGHDNDEWVIDCNASVRNGDPGGAWYTGYGVPNGARAGGTWDNRYIKAVNHTTAIFEIRYIEPAPPGDGWAVYEASWAGDTCLISGWAVDIGVPTTQINVHIYMDGQAGYGGIGVADIVANSPWGGVRAAMQAAHGVDVGPDGNPGDPPGSGHGFHYPVPAAYRDGANHTAYVYGIKQSGGSNWQLNGTPVNFNCGAVTTSHAPWFQTKNSDVVAEGYIIGQAEGLVDSRPYSSSTSGYPTDATNVIINALKKGVGTGAEYDKNRSRFCSDHFYALAATQTESGNVRNCPVGAYDYDFYDNTKIQGTHDEEASDSFRVKNKTVSTSQLIQNLLRGQSGEMPDRVIFNQHYWFNATPDFHPVTGVLRGVKTAFTSWPRQNLGDIITRGKKSLSGSANNRCDKNTLNQTDVQPNPVFPGSKSTFRLYYGDTLMDDPANDHRNKINLVCPTAPNNVLTIGGAGSLTFNDGGRSNIVVAANDFNYTTADGTPGGNNVGTPAPASILPPKDVYIRNDIRTYIPSVKRDKPSMLPNLSITATGNIYIDPAVQNIDASLYATGKIFTCRPFGQPEDYYKTNGPTCNKQLTIRGAVMSRGGFVLGRTYFKPGDQNLADASDQAAEIFKVPALFYAYPPIPWSKWDAEGDNDINFSGYNSFSSPPQLK